MKPCSGGLTFPSASIVSSPSRTRTRAPGWADKNLALTYHSFQPAHFVAERQHDRSPVI